MAAQTVFIRTVAKASACLPLFTLLLLFNSQPVFAAGATLSLNPATVSGAVGQPVTVAIELDTGGNATDGTRVVITFDKNILSVNKVTPGTIYKDYPAESTKVDNTAGTVSIMGMVDTASTYSGRGTFATIEFVPKAAGTGAISIDYAQGSTHESNVADSATATDILSGATGSTVTVTGGTGGTGGGTGGPGGTATDSGSTSKGGLPATATVDPTILLSAVGGAFLMFGAGMFIGTARK